jgi:hypothetical protein
MAFLRRFKSVDALFEKLGISGGKKAKTATQAKNEGKSENNSESKSEGEPKQV